MAKGKNVNVNVTGRTVAYIQTVGTGGKLGKAQPVVVTTVRAGGARAPTGKKKRRSRRKK